MSAQSRLVCSAVLVLAMLGVSLCATPVVAQNPVLPRKPGTTARPGPAEPDPAAELQRILPQLSPADRKLVEEHAQTGKISEEANQRRVVALVDSPFIGPEFGGNNNSRFFVARLTLINLTNAPVVSKREGVQLDFDGNPYPVKMTVDSLRNRPLLVNQQYIPIQNLPMPAELNLAPGARGVTWLVFTELPPGNHMTSLVLKYPLGEANQEWNVVQHERDRLGMKIERIGPRQCLGLIRVSGILNTINVSSLVDELDKLSNERPSRAIIDWLPGSSVSEMQLSNWLQNSAVSSGRAQQQFADQQFPAIPGSIRELHLSRPPHLNANENQTTSYPSNFVPTPATLISQRVHKTEAEAVIAALRTAYEALPIEEVLQAIQTGSDVERAAALAGGGGRLPANRLTILLKYADDPNPLIQQSAVQALSNFGEREALTKLVACAKGGNGLISAFALSGLAGSRYTAAHQALLALLDSEPAEAKKSIVKTMAAYPRPLWSDAIFRFVKDPQSGLNVEALNALVQVGHPQLTTVLADAIRGSDATLKMQAFSILAGRLDRESEELAMAFTLEHLKTQPPPPAMLALLNRVKDRRALPLLLARFNDTPNKSELIQALTRIGDEQTSKFLLERYPSLQNHEKSEVLRHLVRFDLYGFRRLAPQALLSGDNSLVNQAVQGLQEDGSPEAIQILLDAWESGTSSFVWSYVANGLAMLGTSECRAALRKARDSNPAERRPFAINALIIMRQRSPGIQYFQVAQQQSTANNHKEAVDLYQEAIQLDPDLSEAYSGRGHSLLALEKYADAGKDFSKAYELDPYNSIALTGVCLSMILVDGKIDEAIKKLEDDRHKFQNTGNNPVNFNVQSVSIFNYNAACVYGRAYEVLEKNPKAENRDMRMESFRKAGLADLKKSLETGFSDLELLKKDPDLRLFRDFPEFQEIVNGAAESSQQADAPAGPPGPGARAAPPRGR
ncbi:MAG: hypothetical protein JSS02_24475 [Planctomycetes bacterium]|nr:hypothetical protein [Planctomycetota bacterium]